MRRRVIAIAGMHRIAVVSLILLTFCLLTASLSISVNAATLTVGSGGHYRSIGSAVNAAQPGDTIQVGPGTYFENVVVTKPLTITTLNVDRPPIVKAADPDKDVLKVQAKNVTVANLALSGATSASGVHIDHTSGCVVTGVAAQNNLRAIYLEGASNNQVLRSNLSDNGYGVYSDASSHNTISGNVATGERGESHALGDGIYLYYSPGATVTNNTCSLNHVFGISLYNSPSTMIADNTIHANEQIGVRLRDSDGCTLTRNTFSGNGQPGKLLEFPPAASSFGQVGILVGSNSTRVYVNNFVNQSTPVSGDRAVAWNSPQKLTYTYNGVTQTGYLGNYYSDYRGSDSNGTGVGNAAASTGDQYPLVQPFERYVSTSAAASTQHTSSMIDGSAPNLINSAARSFVLGFGVTNAFLAYAAVAFIFLRARRR